ncbi:MAG: DUF3320 domain-containing protein [Planctomycetes bacterium]|nr:DUF3320 domain-containing protein [Planctomycetota bacterium]
MDAANAPAKVPAKVTVEVEHGAELCYAMQQSAVRWLRRVAVTSLEAAPLRDLVLRLELPGFAEPWEARLDELPPGATVQLPPPDLQLESTALANTLERQRCDLVVTLTRGDQPLLRTVRSLDVLAYNEWPGLQPLPALLAAFVAPNHPALAPVLAAVSARLEVATGDGALDGYQRRDGKRVAAMLAAVHDTLSAVGVRYVSPPPSFEQHGQKVRLAEQVLGDRLGTCLDLTLLYAAVLEHIGLDAFVVLLREHAFVGCWTQQGSTPEVAVGDAVSLRKLVAVGQVQVLECTVACTRPAQPLQRAVAAAAARLQDDQQFVAMIDLAAARRVGVRPLPVRTNVFAVAVDGDALGAGDAPTNVGPAPAAAQASLEEAIAPSPAAPSPSAPEAPPPDDRLEHWKQKLLDMSMFNRLLNFAETKKTVRLCAHDLAALEDRLQTGARLHLYPKPKLGGDGDPRDLQLDAERSGVDRMAEYLAEELRAGRMRSDFEREELDTRLVEIFRHARTSLEETGANTLYLAIGFLRWFESPQSQKPRRAPLLLVPIVIERLSVQEGFRFVIDDAEPRVNTTLLQLLQKDFDLDVPLGDALPEDEHGVDVDAILTAFRRATLAMPRWEVEAGACIGFFSFTKYLMWLDLQDRDELLQSPVLQHLVETPGAPLQQEVPEQPRDELDDLDPQDVFCPKDADSSQLAAVLAGAGGRSFVLEGPPGTGKSQTITNLIAQSLATGKRVLFVAEKRAALEVVHRRLSDVGLGPFCLELHSQKSGPKAVLEQLKLALDLGQKRAPAEWQRVAAELQQQRAQLNDFVLALHKRREHGWSVHQAMARLVALRDVRRLPMPELANGTADDVVAARAAVQALRVASAALGVPSEHAWWGVGRGDWTPAVTREVTPMVQRLQRATAGLQAALAPVVEQLGLAGVFGEQGPGRAQLRLLLELLKVLQQSSPAPGGWLCAADWRELDDDLTRAIGIGRRRDELWQKLGKRWRRELLQLDLGTLAAQYRMHAESFFVVRWIKLRAANGELAAAAVGALGAPTQVRDDLEVALRVRDEEKALAGCERARAACGARWQDGLADWAAFERWLAQARALRQLLLKLVPGSLQPDPTALQALARQLDGLAEGGNALSALCGALFSAHDEFAAGLQQLDAHLQLDEARAFGADAAADLCGNVARRCERWQRSEAELRDHCAYRRAADTAITAGADVLVDAHARGDVAVAELEPVFERAVAEGWLDRIHEREPQLARFRGQDHAAAIERFAELDRQSIRLAAKVVVARLAAELPQLRSTNVGTSELGVLERELKKQRRHKPVRRLLHEIRGLWPRLSPCVLMSPLSVAQFLSREAHRFDLVVFDEASQIPMWDAVGAIGRGRSLIVVGDSRQLPPTSFFQRAAQDDEATDGDVPEDLESVLDECAAAGLPRQSLDWHYRSRHESLIAFSNHHYYQNRLLTFPSPQHAGDGAGVRCVRVAGVYDRAGSQQNRVEAEALVAEVVARLRDPVRSKRSIGVVTFSKAQQTLIEDLLDAERRKDPSLDAALAAADEQLFVKNLENVQGDERDVILFSICYGPDAAGKVYENYGPLNLQGGERRLNVAVTRARRELVVFTSVGPEQVANRTAAAGARHLRNFLDYALRGEAALAAAVERDPSRGTDSPFEAEVMAALVQKGWEVHSQIGCSGYRIDLAVLDPDAPGRYLLGVECDGATYHRAATARDRDRLRQSVLEGLGWRLVRVWSTDWWQDPAGQLERLEAAIDDARRAWAEADAAAAAAAQAAAAAAAAKRDVDAGAVAGAAIAESPVEAGPGPAADAAEPVDMAVAEPAAEPTQVEAFVDPDGPRPYVGAGLPMVQVDAEFTDPLALDLVRTQVRVLLEVEGPLVFDRFVRSVADAWQVSRVTERVRDRAREALPKGALVDGDVVWFDTAQRDAFAGFRTPGEGGSGERDADELPAVEVDNAVAWLLRQHQAIGVDDLLREAARCFGMTRLGSVVRQVMAAAVERLVASGRGQRDEGDGEIVRWRRPE